MQSSLPDLPDCPGTGPGWDRSGGSSLSTRSQIAHSGSAVALLIPP